VFYSGKSVERQFFTPKFFYAKFFTQYFLRQYLFTPKNLFYAIKFFLGQKTFFTPIFFFKKKYFFENFGAKNYSLKFAYQGGESDRRAGRFF